MEPVKIPDKHLTLAENQDEYLALDILVTETPHGLGMLSRWKPNDEELAALNAGCPVQLVIVGTSTHPPVIVGVFDDPAILKDPRPEQCRVRLQDEGKPYPKSSCQACGGSVKTGLVCKYSEHRPTRYSDADGS